MLRGKKYISVGGTLVSVPRDCLLLSHESEPGCRTVVNTLNTFFFIGGFLKEDYIVFLEKHLWNSTLSLTFTHIKREGNVTLALERVMINLP